MDMTSEKDNNDFDKFLAELLAETDDGDFYFDTIEDLRQFALDVSVPQIEKNLIFVAGHHDDTYKAAEAICSSSLACAERDYAIWRTDVPEEQRMKLISVNQALSEKYEELAYKYLPNQRAVIHNHFNLLYGAYSSLYYDYGESHKTD